MQKMKSIRKSVLLFAIATVIIGLFACDQLLEFISDSNMPQIDGEIPQLEGLNLDISIGVVYPSPAAEFEPVRTRLKHGLELALGEINNPQLGDAKKSGSFPKTIATA